MGCFLSLMPEASGVNLDGSTVWRDEAKRTTLAG
jgi:hypothetical protein